MELLLRELGFNNIRTISNSEDTNLMFCCPWHGERHPSCGISVNKEIGACFACGQSFTLPYLVSYVKDISMEKAKDWLEEEFNVERQTVNTKRRIRRIDDELATPPEGRKELPNIKLAPFKSGKILHNYLLDRGFTAKTFKRFKFGWDSKKKRITIPIFWRDDVLAGFIERAVLEPKINGKDNPQYKALYGEADKYLVAYEFEKSNILYPLNLFELPEDKVAIIVEGSLDAPWMHQLGFTNTLSILGSKMSAEQMGILYSLGVQKVVLMLDKDLAGEKGMEKAYEMLKGDFVCYRVNYPEGKNDPQELNRDDVASMLKNKSSFKVLKLKYIE